MITLVRLTRTNAECLSRAHAQRCGISPQMKEYTAEGFTKVAISIKDNALVNAKTNRTIASKELKSFVTMELGCKIHNTALCMKRVQTKLLEALISGQLHWALYLNRGQVKIMYAKGMFEIALGWMECYRGTLQLSKMRYQRHVMALVLMPHSYVVELRQRQDDLDHVSDPDIDNVNMASLIPSNLRMWYIG